MDDVKLRKTYQWRNFLRFKFFVNGIAHLAEQEDHHSNMTISYKTVAVELTTHAIRGLSRNDFIGGAAKI